MIKKEMLRLYAVTDVQAVGKRDFYEQVENALSGGATCLQLREKSLTHEELVEKAVRVKKICEKYGVPLIINDDYRAAVESGADGVHVGAEDTPVSEIRKAVGSGLIIGATAKTTEQALKAESQGADYLGVGAVFPSPTKTNAVRIDGRQLKEICGCVKIPCVAIGGITADNVMQIADCGIAGAAVVSALFSAEDVKAAARQLADLLGGMT